MKIEQVAVQCFTIRDHCKTEEDFRASMKRVSEMGYKAVQISAVGPIAPEVIRSICEDNGLTICATHENGAEIINNPDNVIAKLKTMGCKDTAYPHPHMENRDAAAFAQIAKDLADAATRFKD